MRNDLLRRVSVLVAGNSLASLATFGMTATLARLIPIADFGRVAYAFNISVLLTFLLSFGIPAFLVVTYHREGPSILPEINRLALRLNIWAIPPVALIALGIWYAKRISPADLAAIVLAGVSGLIVPHVAAICQAEGRWTDIGRYQVFSNLLRAALVIATVILVRHARPTAALWASGVALLIGALLIWSCERTTLQCSAGSGALCDHLHDFKNLAITNTVIVLASRADVLLAGFLLVPNDLGAYTAASALVLGMGMLQAAIMSVSLHDAACSGKRSQLVIRRLRQMFPAVAIAILLTFTLSSFAIPLIFGARYSRAAMPFEYLSTTLFLGMLFAPVESHFSAHDTRSALWLKLIQLLGLVICAAVLGRSLAGLSLSVLLSRILGWLWALYRCVRVI